MAAVDFEQRFTYVLAGWEGSAHDALVLRDALARENGLRVPQGKRLIMSTNLFMKINGSLRSNQIVHHMLGKYYLVDGGYGAKPGFLPPFRGVRYHLKEWGRNPVENEKELFNHRHSSLRIKIEQAFGALKRRFKILDDASPFFPFQTQVDIVVACCIIHNWVIEDGRDEFNIPQDSDEQPTTEYAGTESENAIMVSFRQGLAEQMWADRQNQGN
jgi:hypothetical protein